MWRATRNWCCASRSTASASTRIPTASPRGLAAIENDPAIDCFVLDDGFQHRRLHRDADVVLIDATNPFGYGHVLPRGMLREPIEGLSRAHLVIVTRASLATGPTVEEIERTIRAICPHVPIARAGRTTRPADRRRRAAATLDGTARSGL